jgi:hypothetical protein
MGWLINRYNKRSATKFGWDPSWLGAEKYDSLLERKVKEFQKAHALKADGMVGTNTFRRLQLHHESQLDFHKDFSNILVNGRLVPIAWPKVKRDLLPSKCYKTYRRKRSPGVVVTHWDVCTSADSCRRVLEKRNISTHFVIDNDGTIVQLVDVNNIAWHAKGSNNNSIGIDLSNAYYLKYRSRYEKMGHKARPVLMNSRVHGRRLRPHLGYYPEQLEAYKALIRFLNEALDIPLDYPKNKDGSLCTGVYPDAVKGRFKGVINHYNLTRNKIDTAGLKVDEIIESIKKERS